MNHPRQLLRFYNLEAKKSLGQNFLFDENILGRIIAAAGISKRDQVLEIGAGLGSLTGLLAQQAGRVLAVELDGRFLPILEAELKPFDNVDLIHDDILALIPAEYFQGAYKVVANVPYYITGAILRHLLQGVHKPSQLVLTVQKEVAERMTADPPHMSLLSVSVQYYSRTQMLFTIKAGAFWPRPDVDSAVVRIIIDPNRAFDPAQEKAFFRLVRSGFSQKRKQLQKNLRQLGMSKRDIGSILEQAGIDGRRRAETLSIPEWLALADLIP